MLELPQDTSFSVGVLRSIYLRVMNPRLFEKDIRQITTSSIWKDVVNKAIVIEQVLNADPRLNEQYLYTPNCSNSDSFQRTTISQSSVLESYAISHEEQQRPSRQTFNTNNRKQHNKFNQ